MSDLTNIAAVARREYTFRVRTRSFVFGTLVLLAAVLAMAFVPIIVQAVDQGNAQRIAVHVGVDDLRGDPVASLSTLLNARPDTGAAPATPSQDYVVSTVPDLGAARQAATAGDYSAVLDVTRSAEGDLVFVLYTNDSATGRTAGLVHQASTAIAIQDRLARLGVQPSEQASLFAPTTFGVAWPDPTKSGPPRGTAEMVGQDMLGFGLTILIFMMIILYGTWIAMSVVEEKSSRVMEVILNAATPYQLLTGKVLGVGAVAFTQYVAVILVGGAALLAQGSVSSVVLGGSGASTGLPEGLTVGLLLLLGVYGTLGFLLFACLYAGLGSLVSRQEDINTAVMPLTLVSTAGYLLGVYAAMGLLNIRDGWIVALSQFPLVSPFMMLGRVTTGEAMAWEVPLSVLLLVLAIVGALWLAGRLYAAGVLLYGQRPSARAVLRLVRSGA